MSNTSIRIALVGDAKVGKTFLLESMKSLKPIQDDPKKYKHTKGSTFYADQATLSDGKTVSIRAYDVSSDKSTTQFKQTYANKDVILLCFAVDQPLSLYGLKAWQDEILKELGPAAKPTFALVMIQRYLDQPLLVQEKQAKAVLKKLNIASEHTYHANCSDRKALDEMFAELCENTLTLKKVAPAATESVKPSIKSPSRLAVLGKVAAKFIKDNYLKIILGTLLVAAVVTAVIFLWPVTVAATGIVAAAATVSIATAYIGFAVSAAAFTAAVFAASTALIIGVGAFLISKISNPHQPKKDVAVISKASQAETKEPISGKNTSQIIKPLVKNAPVKSVYIPESSSESETDSDSDVAVPPLQDDSTVNKIIIVSDNEEMLSSQKTLSR